MLAVCGTNRIPTRHRPLNVNSQLDKSKGQNSRSKQARSVKDSTYTDAYAQEKVADLSRSLPVGEAGWARFRYVAVSNQMNTSGHG